MMGENNENKANKSSGNASQNCTAIATIFGAIIACAGTIFVAALNPELVKIFSDKYLNPSATPTSQIVVTAPIEPTIGTPPSDPPTSFQEATQFPVSLLKVFEDWELDCISTANWQAYLAGKLIKSSESCYNLVNWGIQANNGNLYVNKTEIHNTTALEYGILTDIHGKTRFEFSVHITDLSFSEIWLGFLEGDTPKSEGVVVVIQRDDNVDVRSLPTGRELVDNVHLPLADGDYNNIKVEFKSATIVVAIDGSNIAKRAIGITPTKLFLGYRALPNAEINAFIHDVEIE
jgi:hypothetical protein